VPFQKVLKGLIKVMR